MTIKSTHGKVVRRLPTMVSSNIGNFSEVEKLGKDRISSRPDKLERYTKLFGDQLRLKKHLKPTQPSENSLLTD